MPHRGGQGALLALLLLLPAAAAQLGLNEERAERERRVDCSVTCPHRSREPVCGTNGRTYSSLCDLDLAICRKVKVSLKHEGECTLEEKCMDERRARQEQIANGERVYVPNCQEDGSYAPLQCHNFTRYCWCSSLDGIPIQETVQSGTLPTCPDRHREAPRTTAPPAGAERCTGRARRSFITRLTNKLVTEYQRVRNTKKLSERKLHRRVVKWKFSELDRNNDRKLQRREYKRLRKTVRKFIKPKKCAKMFPRMCDANGDRSLTEQEWVTCFNRQGDKDRQRDVPLSVFYGREIGRVHAKDHDFAQKVNLQNMSSDVEIEEEVDDSVMPSDPLTDATQVEETYVERPVFDASADLPLSEDSDIAILEIAETIVENGGLSSYSQKSLR